VLSLPLPLTYYIRILH